MWGEPLGVQREEYDRKDLRAALGAFATGVCVVTAMRADGSLAGLTINSFSSVSLNPPLVSWSLFRRSPNAATFRDAEFFAINILAADQRDIADRFACPAADKFAGLEARFTIGIGGAPLFLGAVSSFECRNVLQNYGGDHVLFIGNIERCFNDGGEPLIFCQGRYRDLVA